MFDAVVEWGLEKGIITNGTCKAQYRKLLEEIEELGEAMFDTEDNYTTYDVENELGDCCVVLILLAELYGTDLEKCLGLAYEKINKRNGKMINGQFVKEADLEEVS